MLTVNDAIHLSSFLDYEYVYTSTSDYSFENSYVECFNLKNIIYDKLIKILYDRFNYDTENTCVFTYRNKHVMWLSPGTDNQLANFNKYLHLKDWNYCTCTGSSSINGTMEYVHQITHLLCDFSYLFAAIMPYISFGCSLTYTQLRQLDEKDLFDETFVYEYTSYTESLSNLFQEDEFETTQHILYIILSYILYCAEYGKEPKADVIDISFYMSSLNVSVGTYIHECLQAIFDTFMNCSLPEYYRVLPVFISFIAYPYSLVDIISPEKVTFWLFTNSKIPSYLSWRNCHAADTPLLVAMDRALKLITNPIAQSEDLILQKIILTPDFFQVCYVIGDNDPCRFHPCFRLARDIWDTLYTEWERIFVGNKINLS